MGYQASLYFLPSLAKSQNIELTSAAFLLSVVGISDMVGRASSGVIFDLQKVCVWHVIIPRFAVVQQSSEVNP